MKSKITIDRAGRVVLPKSLREVLNLSPGDTLELSVPGDAVTLRPRRSAAPLQKEQGIWVLRTGERLRSAEMEQTLKEIRLRRTRRNVPEAR